MAQRKDRQLVSSGSPYEEPIGFSRAVRVGDRVIVAGTAPNWPDDHVDPDVEVQTDRCIEIMLAALAQAGASAGDVVRTRTFLVDAADWEAAGRSHGRHFHEARPASTMVVVRGFIDPRWKVEMEAEAIVGSATHVAKAEGSPEAE